MISRFVLVFFARFRDTFIKTFLKKRISPSLGGVLVTILQKPGRMAKAIDFPKKLAENFGPTWFYCRNILKFGILPPAFTNID